MRPGGAYTLIEALGSSPVGVVWSATDPEGRPATVAVLDSAVAGDQQWRDAFAAAATALARPQASGAKFLAANFSASAPWAAFAAEDGPGAERVFLALGVDYQPVGSDDSSSSPPQLADPSNSWKAMVDSPSPSPAASPMTSSATPPAAALPPSAGPAVPVSPASVSPASPPAPVSPASVSPAPVSPASVSPASVSPGPGSPGPGSPGPGSPGPGSAGPGSAGPGSPASPPPTGLPPATPPPTGPPPWAGPASPLPPVTPPFGDPSATPPPGDEPPVTMPSFAMPPGTAPSGPPPGGAPFGTGPFGPGPSGAAPPSGSLATGGGAGLPGAVLATPAPPAPPGSDRGASASSDRDPSDSRMRPWLLVGIVVAIVLIATATVVTLQMLPTAQPTTPSVTTTPPPVVTTRPPQPGLEPPRVGGWPSRWPRLAREDAHQVTIEGLGEVAFPITWNCQEGQTSVGETRYTCGREIDGDEDIGGELIVRDCPAPCDAAQHTANRTTEDAWGQQWRFAGANATIAETLTYNDQPERYGLVLIAYYSGTAGGPVNRQLVLRMNSPESWVNDIRKVANSIRDVARF